MSTVIDKMSTIPKPKLPFALPANLTIKVKTVTLSDEIDPVTGNPVVSTEVVNVSAFAQEDRGATKEMLAGADLKTLSVEGYVLPATERVILWGVNGVAWASNGAAWGVTTPGVSPDIDTQIGIYEAEYKVLNTSRVYTGEIDMMLSPMPYSEVVSPNIGIHFRGVLKIRS